MDVMHIPVNKIEHSQPPQTGRFQITIKILLEDEVIYDLISPHMYIHLLFNLQSFCGLVACFDAWSRYFARFIF